MSSPALQDDATAFVLRLGEALDRYGAAATRVEQAMGLCSERFGLEGQFFGTPTSIFAAFGKPGRQTVGLVRVEPGSVDLGKRSAIDELICDVLQSGVSPREALERLDVIVRAPARYGALLTTLCFALASAAAARFLGGGLREIGAATVVGLAIGLFAIPAERHPLLGRLFEPLAAALASALAVAAASASGPLSTYTVTVSGLVVLLPGLTLTTAMTELALRHLVAGATRFLGGVVTLLFLGLGVAVGRRVADLLPAPAPLSGLSSPTPIWSMALALIVAPLCFGVLLRARKRDFGWIVAMGIAAFASASSCSGPSSARSSGRSSWAPGVTSTAASCASPRSWSRFRAS
jgi:uncharacterized membrane protein YjjP (DUF1212 family)